MKNTAFIVPSLKGKRILLKSFDHSDFELFKQLWMCPINMKYIYTPLDFSAAEALFEQRSCHWHSEGNEWLSLSINCLETDEKLGNIGLKIIDDKGKIAEVGFMIKASAHGKGFGFETVTLLTEFAFFTLKLAELHAVCATANLASCALLEKAGFIRSKLLKGNTEINGIFVDDYLYILQKEIN